MHTRHHFITSRLYSTENGVDFLEFRRIMTGTGSF